MVLESDIPGHLSSVLISKCLEKEEYNIIMKTKGVRGGIAKEIKCKDFRLASWLL